MANQPQTPVGGFAKRHVSGMLKHLDDEEQRGRAHEVAASYKRMFEEEHKWEEVLAEIRGVKLEDRLRVVVEQSPPPGLPAEETFWTKSSRQADRPADSFFSPFPAPTPTGNAFAVGGYWEGLTPTTSAPQTPHSTAPPSLYSPAVPQSHQAQSVYSDVKCDVEAAARSAHAQRLSNHSTTVDRDDVPLSIVGPKDMLQGAEMTLQSCQVDLTAAIDPHLPQLLESLAHEEKKIVDAFAVRDSSELRSPAGWLHVDPDTGDFTTVYDSQRDLYRLHLERRKDKVTKLSDAAVQQAWATRILEDAERVCKEDDDASSTWSTELQSYSYENFLRSIKTASTSKSDPASTFDSESRSIMTSGSSIDLSRQTAFNDTPPIKSPFMSSSPSPPGKSVSPKRSSQGSDEVARAQRIPKKSGFLQKLSPRDGGESVDLPSPLPGKPSYIQQLRSKKSGLLQKLGAKEGEASRRCVSSPQQQSFELPPPLPPKPSYLHQLRSKKSGLFQKAGAKQEEASLPPPLPPKPSSIRALPPHKTALSQQSIPVPAPNRILPFRERPTSSHQSSPQQILSFTQDSSEDDSSEEPPSPSARKARRMGAAPTDLAAWAQAMRQIEASRTSPAASTQHAPRPHHISQHAIILQVRSRSPKPQPPSINTTVAATATSQYAQIPLRRLHAARPRRPPPLNIVPLSLSAPWLVQRECEQEQEQESVVGDEVRGEEGVVVEEEERVEKWLGRCG